MTANEDFLFAQEAIAQGFVTEAQVEEGMLLQKRMAEDLKLDERLGVILVKRGYLAEDQARRVHARIEPEKAGEIRGYKLLDVVGRGAMGTVYRALHLGLNREVAIKVLRPDLVGDRTQVERLKAEAGMLASLDHPNVIRALDAGESNGFPFVVMEFVEGETLRDRIRREGPLPEAEALRITRGIADALERARRMGIVHRDVKPGNILLSKSGTPKLMDLGLAKGPIDLGLTQHGATVGTPQYISPEQAVDPKKADTRSDIYSLGATLYAMLAGRPPFDGQTLAEILTKVLYETPLPVRTIRPEVSPEAGYLVERMMLRDPVLRYRTPALVVEDIDRLSQGTSILPTGFSGNWEAFLLRKRARRILIVGGLTVAAAVLVAFAAHLIVGQMRTNQERTALTERVGRLLQRTVLSPSDDAASVEWKRDQVKRLEEAMADGAEVSNRWELRRRLADLDQVAERFLRLENLRRLRIEPLRSAGQFADAAQELEKFASEGPRGTVPVEIAIARLRAHLRDGSDEALEGAKSAAWTKEPAKFADVARLTEDWAAAIETRYAETGKWKKDRRDALDAAAAAGKVLGVIERGLADVSGPSAQSLVKARQFADLKRQHGEGLNRALDEMDKQAEHLKERFGEARLKSLVRAPFDEAWRECVALVADVLGEVEREADLHTARQEYVDAIDVLLAFETAATPSFPDAAQGASAKREVLEAENTKARTEAQVRWDALLKAVVADLPVGGARAARDRLDEARGTPALVPVRKRFDALAREIDAYEGFWSRAAAGLESHKGEAPAKWLETVRLAGDSATYYKWEITGVDPEALTFTFRSHQGGGVRPVDGHRVRDLSADLLLSLAALTPESVAAHAGMLAMFRLATLPDERSEPDFYARLPLWREVVELFDRAGDQDGPLAMGARESLAALQAEITKTEALAKTSLETATREMAQGFYSESRHHYDKELLQRPLLFTRVVRDAKAAVLAALHELDTVLVKEKLARLLPGVRVTHRGTEDYDVDLLFDMNTVEQGENFVKGLARFVPAPESGGVTPGVGLTNMVLRLQPDGGDRLTRDRPLAWANMFSAENEISIAFDLSVKSPLPFPFFLALDLDGAQVGVLSADPILYPFPPDVPWQPAKERKAPDFDFYGRGRGVLFRAATRADRADRDGTGFGDPSRWKWDDSYQGRHFVGKERELRERKPGAPLAHQYFAFEHHEHPYRVKFTRYGETLRLEVDGQTVYEETKAEFASAASTGLLQILSYTMCDIDNVLLSGRIDAAWLKGEEGKQPPQEVKQPPK